VLLLPAAVRAATKPICCPTLLLLVTLLGLHTASSYSARVSALH
jgi:hypothetical protein